MRGSTKFAVLFSTVVNVCLGDAADLYCFIRFAEIIGFYIFPCTLPLLLLIICNTHKGWKAAGLKVCAEYFVDEMV